MNLSPKSRCKVKRQVNNGISTKLVTPKCSNITTQTKAAKSTGPLAKAFLSQGRSSETRPLGNESAARRLGDLRSLLAIQSHRLPGQLLSSKGHLARRKDEDKCQNHSEDKKLERLSCNADVQLLHQRDRSLNSSGSGGNECVLANQLSTSFGCELEIASGVKSSLDNEISNHPGPKLPSIAAVCKCGANSGGPMEGFANLLGEERKSHQLVFAESWSSQGQDSGSCECPEFGNGCRHCHRPATVFKSRSQQNVFEDFCE